MLSEVFNKEYESGEKDTYDYGKEMKKFYGKKFIVSVSLLYDIMNRNEEFILCFAQ